MARFRLFFFHKKKTSWSFITLFLFRFRTIYFFHSLSSKLILQLVGKQKVLIFATFLYSLDFSFKSHGSTARFLSDKYQIRDHTSFVFAIIFSTQLANFVLHLHRCDENLKKRIRRRAGRDSPLHFLFTVIPAKKQSFGM